MSGAVLTQTTNSLQSEILFHCNAVLTDVIVPDSIDIDVKWFVDGKNVHSETFNAKDRVAGILTEEHWKMGQTVSWLRRQICPETELCTSDPVRGAGETQHCGSSH